MATKTKTDYELTASGDKIAIIDRMVRTLNAHHLTTQAGFYSSGASVGGLGRFFKARRSGDQLEVSDFDKWYPVPLGKAFFHDHNGQNIGLPQYLNEPGVVVRESLAQSDVLLSQVKAARRVLEGHVAGMKAVVIETRLPLMSKTTWGFNFAKAELGDVIFNEYREVSVVRAVVTLSSVVVEQTRKEIPDLPPKKSGFVVTEEAADDLPEETKNSRKVR